MQALLRVAGAAATLLLAASLPARADPCSPALDPLRDEVEARRALVAAPADRAERAERRALSSVRRRLRRRSRSLAKDAATVRASGEALRLLYPSDPAIEALLDGALDGLRSGLALERDDLSRTAGQFPPGGERDRALAGLAEADAALAEADALADDDLAGRSEALAGAWRAFDAAYRAVLQGRDRRKGRPCGERVLVRESGVLLWRADEVAVLHDGQANLLRLTARRRRKPVDDSELSLEVTGFHGVGSYSMAFGSGRWRDGPFTYFGIVSDGTLVVTRYDPTAGIAEGTFAFTARGCLFDCSVTEVTGGAFATRRAVRR